MNIDNALSIGRRKRLEGTALQNQGGIAADRNQLERASRLYQQALELFREAGSQGSMMQTYNLLGVAEQNAGRLAEARAWYEKSRELAVQLKDQVGLANAAGNFGIVWQLEGEVARERGDESVARQHFEEARRSLEETLQVWQTQENQLKEALSWGYLAIIHLRLGDLAAAEHHAHEARKIHESLGLKEAWRDYDTLSEIAQACGDLDAAAKWAKKRDDLRAELKRRAGGGGGLPSQMLKPLQALTLACAQAGFGDGSLGPTEEEALAQIDGLPAPFPGFAAFLRQIAAGEVPPVPSGLPAELGQWLEELIQAIRQAPR